MKKLIFLLLLLLIATPCFAQQQEARIIQGVIGSSCNDCSHSGLLICQNFEGTGYDNGESWAETIGTNGIANEDYTATVLRGSQSLLVYGGDAGQNSFTTYTLSADQSTLYTHTLFQVDSLAAATSIIKGDNSAAANILTISQTITTGTVSVWCGGTGATTVSGMSVGTTYHVWGKYVKGTGANAFCSVEFTAANVYSPTGTGNAYVEKTTGSSATDIHNIKLYSTAAVNHIFDQVLSSTSAITNVCP